MFTRVVRLPISLAMLLIAICGLLLAVEKSFDGFWVLIAFFSPIIVLGFVLDRLRGGGGILGATSGGGIGCAIFGISVWLQSVLSPPVASATPGQPSVLGSYYVVFLTIFGSGLGYLFGHFLSLFVRGGTDTPVWVMQESGGRKKAMIGYRQPTSSPDESI